MLGTWWLSPRLVPTRPGTVAGPARARTPQHPNTMAARTARNPLFDFVLAGFSFSNSNAEIPPKIQGGSPPLTLPRGRRSHAPLGCGALQQLPQLPPPPPPRRARVQTCPGKPPHRPTSRSSRSHHPSKKRCAPPRLASRRSSRRRPAARWWRRPRCASRRAGSPLARASSPPSWRSASRAATRARRKPRSVRFHSPAAAVAAAAAAAAALPN